MTWDIRHDLTPQFSIILVNTKCNNCSSKIFYKFMDAFICINCGHSGNYLFNVLSIINTEKEIIEFCVNINRSGY